jgi:thiamine pyrophosphate-dependent acetolactate synthase large subunit-like protein
MLEPIDIFKVFVKHRGKAIVVPVGQSGRQWPYVTDNENRDINLSGSLGHAGAAALGVALALPNEKIVLFDAEGNLLQNLGLLATIAEKQPRNFYHFLLDNECYATTGGQPVPNAKNIDYAMIAKGAGYPHAYNFTEIEPLARQMGEILSKPGPVFVAIKTVPIFEDRPVGERKKTRRPLPSIKALWQELGMTS